MRFAILSPLLSMLLLGGCASQYDQALKTAQATPFNEQPALYRQFLKEGKLSAEDYKYWMEGWEEERDEKAALASMSPKERAYYRLQKQSLAQQEEQTRLARVQAKATLDASVYDVMAAGNANANRNANTQQIVTAINAQ